MDRLGELRKMLSMPVGCVITARPTGWRRANLAGGIDCRQRSGLSSLFAAWNMPASVGGGRRNCLQGLELYAIVGQLSSIDLLATIGRLRGRLSYRHPSA
jgi:hypothetical protein